MICFPGAKINIGLNIISKREDGFHNIETVFYPIPFTDILEIIHSEKQNTLMETSGLILDIDDTDNICLKAYQLLKNEFKLPPVEIYLHKIIPSGAGLGGGSSDAANTLKLLNELYKLNLPDNQLKIYASKLGSDCAFFVENKPAFASGRGELLDSMNLDLSGYYIYLIKPDVFVSTFDAYKSVQCSGPLKSLKDLILESVETWKESIVNDFEKNVFHKFPILGKIKQDLYQAGAIYASMSGSGSSIYGIFKQKPESISRYNSAISWISML
jgi:4-diphosphocytidyl-2-C-methyl-D-erythritol kinase